MWNTCKITKILLHQQQNIVSFKGLRPLSTPSPLHVRSTWTLCLLSNCPIPPIVGWVGDKPPSSRNTALSAEARSPPLAPRSSFPLLLLFSTCLGWQMGIKSSGSKRFTILRFTILNQAKIKQPRPTGISYWVTELLIKCRDKSRGAKGSARLPTFSTNY